MEFDPRRERDGQQPIQRRKENNPSGQKPFNGQNIKIISPGRSLSTGIK
jgi:hypothetical protein